MATSRSLLAHLYRRVGFGATAAELDRAEAIGWDATVNELVAGLSGSDTGVSHIPPPKLTPWNRPDNNSYTEFLHLTGWWIEAMINSTTPMREKLVLLLHSQFPTAISKVGSPSLMYRQNEIFRTLGPGKFEPLMLAVSKDPAMLIWLDAGDNQKGNPNENFARELMERFTMGIGTYTEYDVREAAKALTGWSISYQTGKFAWQDWARDESWKNFMGHKGDLNGDDIVYIVSHTEASSRFVPARLWSWLAYPVTVNDPVVADLAPAYAQNFDVTELLQAMVNHPAFVSSASLNGLVKQPVEWLVQMLRALKLTVNDLKVDNVHYVLSQLGQELFNPPNVGGWGSNNYWLSTAASLAQLNFAVQVTQKAELSAIWDEPVSNRIEAIGNILGIDSWTNQSAGALKHARHVPQELVALALVSPEFMAN